MKRPDPGTLRPLIVVATDGDGASRRHAFLRSPVRIGRDPAGDVVLDEPFVSLRHGLVQFDDREAWYTDLGSRNGTSLEGRPLTPDEPARLEPGQALAIGPLRLAVERGAPAARPAAPEHQTIRPGTLTALLRELARTPEASQDEAWAASLHPGRVVGRFELVRELGRGGFGLVYEARDTQLGRRVAFKAVRSGGALAAEAGSEWLLHEAEAAAQLSHPHIVQLYDAGSWEGGPYLIYELLRGEGLEARLARGALPPPEVLQLAVEVARAVAHAHQAGVVHRDLKPSNVFLTEEGWAKVLDFGLAHVLGASARLEGGTRRYMAPEQSLQAAPDPRVDVFAAAVMLRETWLGPGLVHARYRAAEPLPGAPPALTELLSRALAEEPRHRPADGRAWLEGLLAVQREAERGPSRNGE
jgi:hypothetical protein